MKTKAKHVLHKTVFSFCMVAVLLAVFAAFPTPVHAEINAWGFPDQEYMDGTYPRTFTEGEPMTLYFYLDCNDVSVQAQNDVRLFTSVGGATSITLGTMSGTFTSSGIYPFTCTAPAAATYYGFGAGGANGNYNITISPPPEDPSPPLEDPSLQPEDPSPQPENSYDYEKVHYDYWLPVLTQLMAMGDTGTVTLDLPREIDHVRHFIFDALYGTNRTLVINWRGETWRIPGSDITEDMLGHNQLFVGNLDGFMVFPTFLHRAPPYDNHWLFKIVLATLK